LQREKETTAGLAALKERLEIRRRGPAVSGVKKHKTTIGVAEKRIMNQIAHAQRIWGKKLIKAGREKVREKEQGSADYGRGTVRVRRLA